jgi:hypothetical protein
MMEDFEESFKNRKKLEGINFKFDFSPSDYVELPT